MLLAKVVQPKMYGSMGLFSKRTGGNQHWSLIIRLEFRWQRRKEDPSVWLQQGARKRKQRRDHFHVSHEKDWYAQQPHGSAITVRPPTGIAKMKIARKTKQNKKCDYIQQPPCNFFLMRKLWLTAHQIIRDSNSEIMQFHLRNPSESSLTS